MPESEIELRSMLADARLGVADNLSWSCALFASPGVFMLTKSWLITIAMFGLVYYLASYKYRREASVAEDAYNRSAELGKYIVVKNKND